MPCSDLPRFGKDSELVQDSLQYGQVQAELRRLQLQFDEMEAEHQVH